MNNYATTLREHNLKATAQRLEIVNALTLNGHVTIEFLYDLMITKFNTISLATIYKNINLMLEASFIQEVKIPNSKSVYELTKVSHSHTVCSKCDNIADVDLDLSTIEASVFTISHFKIEHANLIFTGLCKDCQ